MTCEQLRLSLGASVLGTLTPQDQAEVDRHLLGCPECAAELSELETLPALLATVSLEDVLALGPAGSAARPRRRGPLLTTRRALAAAAAAAVLIGSGTAVLVHDGQSSPASFTATSGPVRMDVAISERRGQAALDLAVRGLPASEQCTLVAVSANGSREVAGSWTANADGGWRGWANSSFPSSDLVSLVLVGPDGRQLVTVPTR